MQRAVEAINDMDPEELKRLFREVSSLYSCVGQGCKEAVQDISDMEMAQCPSHCRCPHALPFSQCNARCNGCAEGETREV